MPGKPVAPTRSAAPHVQTAVARTAQPSTAPRAAVQPRLPTGPALRAPAPHVQAALQSPPPGVTSLKAVQAKLPPRVVQPAAAVVTTLSKEELIASFEAEVKGWTYGWVRNTGHGGPRDDKTTREDVVVSQANFDSAVTELRSKVYKTPRNKDLKYNRDGISGSQRARNVYDIIFSEDGKEPAFGVESLNYHIKLT